MRYIIICAHVHVPCDVSVMYMHVSCNVHTCMCEVGVFSRYAYIMRGGVYMYVTYIREPYRHVGVQLQAAVHVGECV